MKKNFIITVDGGAASGKSSTAKAIAEQFNLLHVDTGLHYRTLTHYLLTNQITPEHTQAIQSSLQGLQMETEVIGRSAVLKLGPHLVAENQLRSEVINQNVSLFAALPEIRTALLTYQRAQTKTAEENHFEGLIIEGRDIGSVIFPDAPIRIFLEADLATRTHRREQEGLNDTIAIRDKIDGTRTTAPLCCPPGATRIDSSKMDLKQVVARVSKQVENFLDSE